MPRIYVALDVTVTEGGTERLYRVAKDELNRAIEETLDATSFDVGTNGVAALNVIGIGRTYTELQESVRRREAGRK